jgi:hypothetical protein
MNVFYPGDQIADWVQPKLLATSPLRWVNLDALWDKERTYTTPASVWIPETSHTLVERDPIDFGTNINAIGFAEDIRNKIKGTLDKNKLRGNMEYIIFFMKVLEFAMNSRRELGSEITVDWADQRQPDSFRRVAIYWDNWLPIHANSDLVRSSGATDFDEFREFVRNGGYSSVFTPTSLQKGATAINLLKSGGAYTNLPLEYRDNHTSVWTSAGNGSGWSVRIWQDVSHGFTVIWDSLEETSPSVWLRVAEIVANLKMRLSSEKISVADNEIIPEDLNERLGMIQQLGSMVDYLWSSPLALQLNIPAESPYAKLPIPRYNRAYERILGFAKTQLDTWISSGSLFENIYGPTESRKVQQYITALNSAMVGSWYSADFTLLNGIRLNWERTKIAKWVSIGIGSTHLTAEQKEIDNFNNGGWANSSLL